MKSTIVLASLIFAGGIASAAEEYQGVDITPAVESVRSIVHELTAPVFVYNWAPTAAYGDAPSLVATAGSSADAYWSSYGGPGGNENMYGFGLYTSVDPVATFGYGLGFGSWRVLEIALPKGFRMLDLTEPQEVSAEAAAIFKMFNCPSPSDAWLAAGGETLDRRCVDFARHVFRDVIGIDGFSYGYTGSRFSACVANQSVTDRAFVITSGRTLTEENAKYFTEASTKDVETRVRIQTLFLEAAEEGKDFNEQARVVVRDHLRAHPDDEFLGSRQVCEGAECRLEAQFSGPTGSAFVPLFRFVRSGGGTILAADAAKKSPNSLLWKDLEGHAKTDLVRTWLRKNKFGCDGNVPYGKR